MSVSVFCLPYRVQHRAPEDDDELRAQCRVPAPGVLLATNRHHLAQDPPHEGNHHLLPLLHTLLLYVAICLHHWAFWRILCFWIQKSFQDQRFWRHHPRTRRNNGPVRLSVPDGDL